MSAADVLEAFRDRGWQLATAESCTGGMISAALTDIPGSSDVLDRGFVTYSNAAKTELLGVRPATLSAHGAVSAETAAEMAEGALSRSTAQVAVAVTGVAGPGGSAQKPEGLVWFGFAVRGMATRTSQCSFGPIGRAQVRQAAVRYVLDELLQLARTAKF